MKNVNASTPKIKSNPARMDAAPANRHLNRSYLVSVSETIF